MKDFPVGWMKGDTHYRPTWNIDIPVRRVGYGVAKSTRTGQWYATAIWLPVEAGEVAATATEKAPRAAASPPAVKTRVLGNDAPNGGKNWIPADLKTIDGKKPHGIDYFLVGNSSTIESELTRGGILYRGDILGSGDGRLSPDHR